MFDIFNDMFDVNGDGNMDLGEKTMELMMIDELAEDDEPSCEPEEDED